jgi:hypothetical protein
VNEALQGARLSVLHSPPPNFPACLTQNIANGNTLVMNAAAAALVAGMEWPEGTVHDWWSYIVVSACGGDIMFDEQPQVLYRLHKNNLIGSAKPARALAAMRRGPGIFMTMMRRHAETLAAQAGLLTPQARQDLRIVQRALDGGVWARLKALKCARFRRRTGLENLLFPLLVPDREAAARGALGSPRAKPEIACAERHFAAWRTGGRRSLDLACPKSFPKTDVFSNIIAWIGHLICQIAHNRKRDRLEKT